MFTSCDCSKLLLTCCVPNLKLDSLTIKLYCPYLEVNTGWGRVKNRLQSKISRIDIDTNSLLLMTQPMVVIKLVVIHHQRTVIEDNSYPHLARYIHTQVKQWRLLLHFICINLLAYTCLIPQSHSPKFHHFSCKSQQNVTHCHGHQI